VISLVLVLDREEKGKIRKKKHNGERHTWLTVHVTLDVQLTTQTLRSTEKHTRLSRTMDLADALEDRIPVRSTKVGWCSESSNRITIRVRIIDHYVRRIVNLHLGGKVGVDLDVVIHVLGFDGEE